ncbi:MAG: transglutaminase-like domain-containing protein [Pirellulales bacterium]
MRATVLPVTVIAGVFACFGAALTAPLSAQEAQEEVEDTVVATDADSRPAYAKSDAGADDSAVKAAPAPARATRKDRYAIPDPALELVDPRTYRLKVAIRIEAAESLVRNVVATGPIPMNWPEQRVRLISEQMSPGGRCREQILPGQAALIRFQVAKIPQGETAFVERLYEITRYRTKFTLPGDELALPRGTPPELKEQVAGMAPGVDIGNPKMIELADMLRTTSKEAPPWETVKAFWSWTRDNVKFENGDYRGAMHAIDERCGDCEEMSALFVGLCRLSGIPARTVWVESHDYPEFYLVDKQGQGHWIPAQVLGPPWFGEMAEYRPILQKGDRFYDPLKKEYVRYVPQTVKGADAKALPKVEFRHEIIADTDINAPTYNNRK